MKEKFKKVKDRYEFYSLLAKETGCDIHNVSSNWFVRKYLAVPKAYLEMAEKLLDKFLEFEAEKQKAVKKLHTKYFGK